MLKRFALGLLWLQTVYYGLTGIWPLVSIETFQVVTGKKTDHLVTGDENDHWLVMTVGVLITAIAISLFVAAWRRSLARETITLAVSAAIGLAAIDFIYVSREVLLPGYLADAAIECLLIAGWLGIMLIGRGQNLDHL
jgi:hypothetical protein